MFQAWKQVEPSVRVHSVKWENSNNKLMSHVRRMEGPENVVIFSPEFAFLYPS
jgi:hypothetical protein